MNTKTEIPIGFCECGCGQQTPIIPCTQTSRGLKKGEPHRFISGHNKKHHRNFDLSAIGKFRNVYGYIYVKQQDHPRAKKFGYVLEHILVAEKMIGRLLKGKEVVHHKNGKRDDNRPENLLVCESTKDHHKHHVIARALAECGNPHWRKCQFCKNYDDPAVMVICSASSMCHKSCRNIYQNRMRAIKRN